MNKPSFRELFKKYRLKSEFETLTQFGNALADKGLDLDDSIFSHWQKGTRTPTNRYIVLKLLELFIEHKAIQTTQEANEFLSSAGHGYLSEIEAKNLKTTEQPNILSKYPLKLDNSLEDKRSLKRSKTKPSTEKSSSSTEHTE